MRVDHSKSNPAQAKEGGGAKGAGKAAAPEAKKVSKEASTDSVEKNTNSDSRPEISSKGKEFATAKAAASQAPDVREEKIAELKKRIAEGSYKVNSEAIADKMVEDHLRMPG
jgi:negative regulator of flagellin synthesis FlgM